MPFRLCPYSKSLQLGRKVFTPNVLPYPTRIQTQVPSIKNHFIMGTAHYGNLTIMNLVFQINFRSIMNFYIPSVFLYGIVELHHTTASDKFIVKCIHAINVGHKRSDHWKFDHGTNAILRWKKCRNHKQWCILFIDLLQEYGFICIEEAAVFLIRQIMWYGYSATVLSMHEGSAGTLSTGYNLFFYTLKYKAIFVYSV